MLQKLGQSIFKNSFRQNQNYNFSRLASHRIQDNNSDSVPFDFTPENYKNIDKILAKYPAKQKRSGIMPLLWLAQEQNENWVPLSAMKKIAKILEVSDMDVYEVATFYTMYNRTPVGKFQLQICGTTPCMLCGARDIAKAIEEYTGCKIGESSKDGLWTVEEVECLGACSNAPMIQVNNQYVYEDLTPENTKKLLDDLQKGTEKKGPQNHRIHALGPEGKTCLKDTSFLEKPIRHNRDFAKAKKEWEQKKEAAKQEAAAQAKKK